jgi:hypothetical protein
MFGSGSSGNATSMPVRDPLSTRMLRFAVVARHRGILADVDGKQYANKNTGKWWVIADAGAGV